MFKRFRKWCRLKLSRLHLEQENLHGGRSLVAVYRRGRLSWEVWDFGPNAGSSDADELVWKHPKSGRPLQLEKRARLLLATDDLGRAKALV